MYTRFCLASRFASCLFMCSVVFLASSAVGQTAERALGDVQNLPLDVTIRENLQFVPGDSSGLFVGIRKFENDEQLAEIPYAVDDAVDLAYTFAIQLQLISPENVTLCLSGLPEKTISNARLRELQEKGATLERAEQSIIYKRLAEQASDTGPSGLYVVSFATHGFSDQGADFLVAADSIKRRIARTGIAVNEVLDETDRARTPRKIVLIDACRERLTNDTRAGGAAPESAMGAAFAKAISEAEGQVVLTGTVQGGYSYDDTARQNGVFTSAVIDGLMGSAEADSRGFVTASTLSDYVNRHVTDWVHRNRPEKERGKGIERRLSGEAAELPLAVSPRMRDVYLAYRKRIDEKAEVLRRHVIEGAVPGLVYDQVKYALDNAEPDMVEPVLLRLEIFEKAGGIYAKDFVDYWETDARDVFKAYFAAKRGKTSSAAERSEVKEVKAAEAPEGPPASTELTEGMHGPLNMTGLAGEFYFPQSYEKRTPDNRYYFTDILIPPQVTLKMRDPQSTGMPIYWYATGRVEIAGILDLNGENGAEVETETQRGVTPTPAPRSIPGMGGFAGGASGSKTTVPENGMGPGGGRKWGSDTSYYGGSSILGGGAGHALLGEARSGYEGPTYGHDSLSMLVGGSGGAGGRGSTSSRSSSYSSSRYYSSSYSSGYSSSSSSSTIGGAGGAGGGAILIASQKSISVTGRISANGGQGGGEGAGSGGGGSGGSIFLAAPTIEITGMVEARGGGEMGDSSNYTFAGSPGRIRVEAKDYQGTGVVTPTPSRGLPWWMKE